MVLGGLFASALSWRVGFFINVPLALFMLIVAWRVLTTQSIKHEGLDGWGAGMSILGLFSLVYTINGATHVLPWALVT
ncbi:MFS transporter, partial [Levilactobacillus spicheri]